MPGRGRSSIIVTDGLRRPGSLDAKSSTPACKKAQDSYPKGAVLRILTVTSPDDIEIQNIATEVRSKIRDENDLKELVDELCEHGLNKRNSTSVIGAFCGMVAHHQVGETKFRTLLLKKVQKAYAEKDVLASGNRYKFVTSAMFLGEIFYNLKSENGTRFKFLVEPVIQYLAMVLKPHLVSKESSSINEEMMVVAKLMHMNSALLYSFDPTGLEDIVCSLTEIMIRHPLDANCRLNLLAALAELWPKLQPSMNPSSTHATLATKLGLSLNI